MNSTNFPRFVMMLIAINISLPIFSQQSKEAVILYNTKPVLAEITSSGTVTKIIKDEPDFLKGFTLKVQDYGQLVADSENKPNENAKNKSITEVPKEISTQSFSIDFNQNYATLSGEAVSRMDKVVDHIKNRSVKQVVLRTLSRNGDNALIQNRLNSIKSYLRMKGLTIDIISFESASGPNDPNEVLVSFDY